MAKKAKVTGAKDDVKKAAIIGVLKRAISVIEGEMSDKKTELEPGGYPVDVTITVAGDITVTEPAARGEPRDVLMFTDRDLLGGLFADSEEAEIDSYIARSVAQIAKGEKDGKIKARIKGALALVDAAAARCAEKKNLIEKKAPPQQRGKTLGDPSVDIDGSVGKHIVTLNVKAA